MNLKQRLLVRFSLAPVMVGGMLFIPAGSLRFWQGWTFLVLVFAVTISSFIYFLKHDPQLVERRLQSKEKVREQRRLINLTQPAFFAAFLVPGLDYRFGWSRTHFGGVPLWLCLVSHGLVLGGLLFVFWVLKVNSFASRTIRVEAGQRVISSGPYRMVRHPMYAGSLMMWLFTPLALGSYFAWPACAALIPFYTFRLVNEEKVLRQELPGYSEYCLRTRFRLVPFIW